MPSVNCGHYGSFMDHKPSTPTSVVAARMRELRSARQWSAQRLSDEMNRVGIDWNRGVVSKLETGRREGVSVAELLALSVVLDVSPIALLVPSAPERYAITPNQVAEMVLRVYDWIVGRAGQPFGEQDPSYGAGGIPSGLPDWLAARERQFIAERDHDLYAVRIKNAELEAKPKPHPSADPAALFALLEQTGRGLQEAERARAGAEMQAHLQVALIRRYAADLPEDVRARVEDIVQTVRSDVGTEVQVYERAAAERADAEHTAAAILADERQRSSRSNADSQQPPTEP